MVLGLTVLVRRWLGEGRWGWGGGMGYSGYLEIRRRVF